MRLGVEIEEYGLAAVHIVNHVIQGAHHDIRAHMATRRQRPPTRPGEILHEEFLVPLGLTQKELADHLGCDVKVVNRIVNGRTSVTAAMALKLGATFRTTPELWLNAQKAVDLYRAANSLHELPEPMVHAG